MLNDDILVTFLRHTCDILVTYLSRFSDILWFVRNSLWLLSDILFQVNLCREVFADTLNESRDPDRGTNVDRYTARYGIIQTIAETNLKSISGFCHSAFLAIGIWTSNL